MCQERTDSVTQGFTEPCPAGADTSCIFPIALPTTRQREVTDGNHHIQFYALLEIGTGAPDGVAAFRAFLKTEFSEENLEFWLACEEFKKTRSTAKLVSKAHRIFEEFVDVQAPREVNIDFQTREATRKNMQEPSLTCFDQAQGKVHSLMEKDSYPRFLRSKMYLDLLSQSQRRLS
ncbi:regulator of G-protein signaling 8 [Cricetulus griseus]